MKIGFIGLGLMGSRMAENLLKNNYKLVVFNRTKEKAEPLVEKGAELKASPAEVAKEADIVITMLSNPDAVKEVSEQFLHEMREDKIWIDSSTVNPSFSRKMSQKAKEYKVRFVDAPVAGSIKPAAEGELVFLIGGNENDVEECLPLFDAMGKKSAHIGGIGMGTSMKMVVNTMLGLSMLAFSEAVTLGETMGIEKDKMMNLLLGGPVVPAFITGKKNMIVNNDYETEFPLKHMTKDLRLADLSSEEKEKSLNLLKKAKEIFSDAEVESGELDFSSIYKYVSDK